ncbi:putative glycoside hydrolase [Methanobrevibacter millerae]|uniref:Glycosyl hydrolase domain-containing protein n=1 Tax=Methanobrevibacter millerae TaxID=230361 RepID=A0A1G5WE73_9EURY|nr:putative glycoside hydrolase [Methanobrevibacter millerae]SDA55847.1 Putative glycosyl hydrolase domain-containing protein [Methanobrevibacter millerae]
MILTLFFIFSISIVSADNFNSTDIADDSNADSIHESFQKLLINSNNLSHDKKSVSKDFDFFGLFDFGHEKKYGYWVWAKDMNNVDFDKLSKNGVNVVFLNSFAFTEYGQREVLDWIHEAREHDIEVHVWMQIFNTGNWISPLKNGTPDTRYFNYKIEEARYYAGLDEVSGIQIDYIRFEGNAYRYNNSTEAINMFVKNFSDEMRKINPDLTLSATVMPETDNDEYFYGQDIKTICKYVDVIVPMMYKGNYNENSSWIENTTRWFVDNSGDAEVWCGLQTYDSDYNVTALSADELIKDKDLCFKGGADGVFYFKWGMNNDLESRKIN